MSSPSSSVAEHLVRDLTIFDEKAISSDYNGSPALSGWVSRLLRRNYDHYVVDRDDPRQLVSCEDLELWALDAIVMRLH